MSAPAAAEARALLTALTRALTGVAVLALVFTAVNVTLFATSRGVTPAIAILLDPMVALALAAILYADARLAAWGIRPPRWSAALRWFTGITATLMNTWDSIWPDRQIGTPIHADPAGIVLHGVPTVLLILLTETIAAYRRTVAPLLDPIAPTAPTPGPDPSSTPRPDEPAALSHPLGSPAPAPGGGTATGGPHSADSPPTTPPARAQVPMAPLGRSTRPCGRTPWRSTMPYARRPAGRSAYGGCAPSCTSVPIAPNRSTPSSSSAAPMVRQRSRDQRRSASLSSIGERGERLDFVPGQSVHGGPPTGPRDHASQDPPGGTGGRTPRCARGPPNPQPPLRLHPGRGPHPPSNE